MANNTYSASGGSGAGYHAKIIITDAGYYDVVVGSGGTGIRGGFSSSTPGGDGKATTLKKGETTLISAGGGTGGKSGPVWATAGSGGTLSKNVIEQEVYVSQNGNNGNAYAGGGNNVVNGASGPINGHSWGATGSAQGWYGGGSYTNPSYHGYFYIKYEGPAPNIYEFIVNPTPSDATVTLTVGGTTYNKKSIMVMSGTTVSWSVSKSGYTTQTGTNTITEDTTEIVELEELQEPLYYCYYGYLYGQYGWVYTKSGEMSPGNTTYCNTNLIKVSSPSEFGTVHFNIVSCNENNLIFVEPITHTQLTFDRDTTGDLYT